MWPFTKNQNVRTRIAPSPTGNPHLGILRTVLYDYLLAKSKKGSFIVRIEDTDQRRAVEGSVEKMLEAFQWLGITWDEGPDLRNEILVGEKGNCGPYFQSKRLDRYVKYAHELLAKNVAYYCYCTPEILDQMRKQQLNEGKLTKYDGRCRDLSQEQLQENKKRKLQSVIRLKMPRNETITFTDFLRGEITISSNEVEDQILMKSDGYPTYHLASVIDDHQMKISHVLRGEEWIASTPKHAYLYTLFGWEQPVFVHLSLIRGANNKKLSKRDGSFSVDDLRSEGYLPEAVLNYLVLLGWRKKNDDREFYTLSELVKEFRLEDLNKAPAVFDHKKLDWYNAHYIKEMSASDLANRVRTYLPEDQLKLIDDAFLERLVTVEQPRFTRLTNVEQSAAFYLGSADYEGVLLLWKDMTKEHARANLEKVHILLKALAAEEWSIEKIEKTVKDFIERESLTNGEVLWPMRVALTGAKKSPGPFESAYILQKDRATARLVTAVEKLS